MERTRRPVLPAGVKRLRARIDLWRRARQRRTAMPAELCSDAVALAKSEGIYRIARTLRVDYQALVRRVAEASDRGGQAGNAGLVELRGADLLGSMTVVEVSDGDGARLTIRIGSGTAVDAAALVGAFRRPGADTGLRRRKRPGRPSSSRSIRWSRTSAGGSAPWTDRWRRLASPTIPR